MAGSGGSAPAPPAPTGGGGGSTAGGGGSDASGFGAPPHPPPSSAANNNNNNALAGLYNVSIGVQSTLPALASVQQLRENTSFHDRMVSLLLQNFNEAPDAASKDAIKQIRTLAASVNPDDQHPPDLVAIKRWLI